MNAPLSQQHETAASELAAQLAAELGDALHMLVLYGSVARGEAHEDSDIDLLLVAADKRAAYARALDLAFANDLKHETHTTLIAHTPQEFERLLQQGEPLIDHVLNEGEPLNGTRSFHAYRRTLQSGAAVS